MDNYFRIERNNLTDGVVVSETITLRLSDKQLVELREVAREFDEPIEALLELIPDTDLINMVDEDCFIEKLKEEYMNTCIVD